MTLVSKLDNEKAMLLIIDVQQAFMGPIKKMKTVVQKTAILAKAANVLSLPVLVTEQYPKGLGNIVKVVAESLGEHSLFEKTSFSCMADPQIKQAIEDKQRSQVIIAGVEAHVCVLQTTLDLLAAGKEVFIVTDAVSSRDSQDRKTALNRMSKAGAIITTTETTVMELIGGSRHEHFKVIQALIK